MAALREGEEQLEDLHTLTCFYLAQAHGNLGARERSASYCHRTMIRQLARRGGSAQGEHAFQASWHSLTLTLTLTPNPNA